MASPLADGSWNLTVEVEELQTERVVRVKGETHIGGLMLKLVESLNIQKDWSDHGLFWPEKNVWLLRTKCTLDQLGVTSTSTLTFTPMHKVITLVLPDLREMACVSVDFSVNVFSVVAKLCKDLGIRHSEELSLTQKLSPDELRKNKGISATRRSQLSGPHTPYGLTSPFDTSTLGSPNRHLSSGTPQSTLGRRSLQSGNPMTPTLNSSTPTTLSRQSPGYSPYNPESLNFDPDSSFAITMPTSIDAVKSYLYYPKSYAEKARINAGWLDSSRSLLEQGIKECDMLFLKFKFFSFYDLNLKYDAVRINQIYEQAKWSVLSEEVDCTEEEMITLAAIQLQVTHQSTLPQPSFDQTEGNQTDDEIDAALNDLQTTLEGSNLNSVDKVNGDNGVMDDITETPELREDMRFYKPKKFGLKTSKKYHFTFKETTLTISKLSSSSSSSSSYHHHHGNKHSHNNGNHNGAIYSIDLKGCEVSADVNVSTQKFVIKLLVPSEKGASEFCIKPEREDQYARWMAAFKLATRGHTMADSSYASEVRAIESFLRIHHPSPNPSPQAKVKDILKGTSFEVESYVAPRFLSKIKGTNQIVQRIIDAQMNVGHLNMLESKLQYMKLWQALPEYGLTYFIVKLKGAKKEELLAISPSRLILMDLSRGDTLKSWTFQTMKSWNVNWEIKQVQVCFEEEDLIFQCLTADCKVVHEFIGGYIFLCMRSMENSHNLDQDMFHKLTSGWE
ncbi:hypothetical protein HELRODRAFT_157627 [Helobdella robusta]|uniref:PH domain-containing protein n=1 Tax=Helobdella robusta TaxID=6412 RepID=T1EME2_HELRO|nr:hypothetical protein HELRODRAFT_157627 [Helobdella robusta]ESN95786.1 hypothetical protein HELRODRAFT_157627 [Helobdella robusta]